MKKDISIDSQNPTFKIAVDFRSMNQFLYDYIVLSAKAEVLQQLTKGSNMDTNADVYSYNMDKKYNNAFFMLSPIRIINSTESDAPCKFAIQVFDHMDELVDEFEITQPLANNILSIDCAIQLKLI